MDFRPRLPRSIRLVLRVLASGAVVVWFLDMACDEWVRNRPGLPTLESSPGRYRLPGKSTARVAHICLGRRVQESRSLSAWPTHGVSDRLARAREANRGLLSLVLFAEGRGMHSAPAAATLYAPAFDSGWKGAVFRAWIGRRTGAIFDHYGEPLGMWLQPWGSQSVPVQGCAVCHCGKVLGQIVPGLGNKNIDPAEAARLDRHFDGVAGAMTAIVGEDAEGRTLAASARRFGNRLARDRFDNLSQGLVSVSVIRSWFYESQGLKTPPSASRSLVKTPALWGYGPKRASGLFCDGMGAGSGWLASVELAAGQTPATVRGYLPALRQAEEWFASLLPPAYPLPIDWSRASRGKAVFVDRCAACHGEYSKDAHLLPSFAPPQFVALGDVGTDPSRLSGNTEQFFRLVAASSLCDVVRIREHYQPGYLAPRLEGIWARFPYLHNGSVPNLSSLLSKVSLRPAVFSLRDAGEVYRFDPQRLGLTVPKVDSQEAQRLAQKAAAGTRDVYSIDRAGHSNQGHEFGIDCSEREKADLLEYLKTL